MTNKLSKLVTAILIFYFILSGVLAQIDLELKLFKIDLAAVSDDGLIAFGIIYASTFIGVGIAMAVLWKISRTTQYSLVLACSIISMFLVFRILGVIQLGYFSPLQIKFLCIEILELAIIFLLLSKVSPVNKQKLKSLQRKRFV